MSLGLDRNRVIASTLVCPLGMIEALQCKEESMTPILSLAIGLIVGLVAMWLIMRYTVGKREQEQATRLSKQLADLENQRTKDREEIARLESRMQHREQDNAELKERLSKAEGQVRECEQARLAADAQARSSESARSDLERALTRLEQQVKERDAMTQQLQSAMHAQETAQQAQQQAQQQTIAELRNTLAERDRALAALTVQQADRAKQVAESEEIIAALRTNLKAEGNDAMGLRQAIKRQQAEINNLRQRLTETSNQLASRNERVVKLQKALAERKQVIANLRKRQDAPARSKTAGSAPAEQASRPSEAPAETSEVDRDELEALDEVVGEELHLPVQFDGGALTEEKAEVSLRDEEVGSGEEQEVV